MGEYLMGTNNLSRREFLKLVALLPLLRLPTFENSNKMRENTLGKTHHNPNVLILVFDAWSAKHVSTLGYQRDTTPNLTRIAEKATVFHQHYSAGNFTAPGTASLLTGTYPWKHRALHYFATLDPPQKDQNLFKLFADAGYQTMAYTQNGLVMELLYSIREYIDLLPHMGELSVLNDRFTDEYFDRDYLISFNNEGQLRGYNIMQHNSYLFSFFSKLRHFFLKRDAEIQYQTRFPLGLIQNYLDQYFILEDSVDWIIEQCQKSPQPFMGYIHFWPPHDPYMTRQEFLNTFDDGWFPSPKPLHPFSDALTPPDYSNPLKKYGSRGASAPPCPG